MSDRPVSLDLRTPSGQAQSDRMGNSSGGAARGQADPDAIARFSDGLRAGGAAAGDRSGSSTETASPFSLFGRAEAVAVSGSDPVLSVPVNGAAGDAASPETLWDRSLQDNVKRLMVAEDQRSLRMDLDPTAFPGVIVEVFEDAGAWVAQFTCSERSSFDRLAGAANEMSLRMAEALGRDALWRVIAEGPGLDGQDPVEAFSSSPGGGRS